MIIVKIVHVFMLLKVTGGKKCKKTFEENCSGEPFQVFSLQKGKYFRIKIKL